MLNHGDWSARFLLILTLLDEVAGGPLRDSLHTSLFLVVLRCPFGPKHPSRVENGRLYTFHSSC